MRAVEPAHPSCIDQSRALEVRERLGEPELAELYEVGQGRQKALVVLGRLRVRRLRLC